MLEYVCTRYNDPLDQTNRSGIAWVGIINLCEHISSTMLNSVYVPAMINAIKSLVNERLATLANKAACQTIRINYLLLRSKLF